MANPDIFTKEEKEKLRAGKPVDVGGHRYGLCQRCRRVICLTGWFGSLHLCE